jgi:hypothetical protein
MRGCEGATRSVCPSWNPQNPHLLALGGVNREAPRVLPGMVWGSGPALARPLRPLSTSAMPFLLPHFTSQIVHVAVHSTVSPNPPLGCLVFPRDQAPHRAGQIYEPASLVSCTCRFTTDDIEGRRWNVMPNAGSHHVVHRPKVRRHTCIDGCRCTVR